jgi:dolichol-phosphate mannosyltransferase
MTGRRSRYVKVKRLSPWSSAQPLLGRLIKFSAVGSTGILVQAMMLVFFLRIVGLHYLAATALAVELSVLHNFLWHRKWTWADRQQSCAAMLLLRFNLTSGVMSLVGNLVLMFIFVGEAKLDAYTANLVTIAICSLINFMLSDRFVFV